MPEICWNTLANTQWKMVSKEFKRRGQGGKTRGFPNLCVSVEDWGILHKLLEGERGEIAWETTSLCVDKIMVMKIKLRFVRAV